MPTERVQTLLGATGTGKTFTMAATIERVQRPALVIAHNKTLAAQLCNEFREFFPNNAVEYFVSYYDYYQPEAYVPAQDLYIEKDSSINDEIDRLRHSATASLFARQDVIIVASVSCIYGIGSPKLYRDQMQLFKVGEWIDREELFRKLVAMQYRRNDTNLGRGTFSARGEVLEIMPAYAESAYRIQLFGDEIEGIQHFDPLTGEVLDAIDHVSVWPASHYVVEEETHGAGGRRDRARADGAASQAFEAAGQAARGPPARRSGPSTTWRCCASSASARGSRTTRESSTAAPPGEPALHADRLLPRRLRHASSTSPTRRSRRSAACTRATSRASRRWSTTASGCPRRSTTVRSSSTSSSDRVGQMVLLSATPGPVGARAVVRTSSSRSCARPGSSTPRSRCARPRTRSTT